MVFRGRGVVSTRIAGLGESPVPGDPLLSAPLPLRTSPFSFFFFSVLNPPILTTTVKFIAIVRQEVSERFFSLSHNAYMRTHLPLLHLIPAKCVSIFAGWMEILGRRRRAGDKTILDGPRHDLSNCYGAWGKCDGDKMIADRGVLYERKKGVITSTSVSGYVPIINLTRYEASVIVGTVEQKYFSSPRVFVIRGQIFGDIYFLIRLRMPGTKVYQIHTVKE